MSLTHFVRLSLLILLSAIGLVGCGDASQSENNYQTLITDAKSRIQQIDVQTLADRQQQDPNLLIIDVREDNEWLAGHIRGAIHINRGILERQVSERFPDLSRPIILYCEGGGRSALSADSLQ
nr:hypothetical protein [Legionellales bacterium]